MLTPTSVQDAVLILAYRLTDKGEMDVPLIKRLEMGVELYRKEKKQAIIVSGWRGNKRLDLAHFNEAELMRAYIHKWYPDILVFTEPDSTGIQTNLLFTRKRFPGLKKLTVVTAARALDRTRFHGEVVFGDKVEVRYAPCVDGVSEAEREIRMLGDVRCMLRTEGVRPGEWEKLMLPSSADGRLRSKWDAMAEAHKSCQWYHNRHPDTP